MKKLFFLFLGFLCITANAQSITGKATYQSKTVPDFKMEGEGITDEMRKQIEENLKRALEKSYTLEFTVDESLYKEEQVLDVNSGTNPFRVMMVNFSEGVQYKNSKENVFLQEQEFFGKQFLITDTLQVLDWQLTNESKQIGQYVAFKATAIKKLSQMDWRSMRRKNQEEDSEKVKDSTETSLLDQLEMPEEIEITAWFTPQIPVSHGPGEFYGLPGLILEVQSDKTSILCSKIVLNPNEGVKIKKPSKGTQVTREEFAKIAEDKMREMQEMYGGRQRGGGNFNIRFGN